ncbi:rod shape-determining protein [Desulfoluna sp.]|uniref:rod shape-determining protein n=1 Tax=Desulfoluna sp. TaxID=2045199 RepID=UPI0026038826|nr:rod shape-determining protein [Desulfoluna sp.]
MLNFLCDTFFRHTFYIKFSGDWVSVKHVETGKTYEDRPLLAIKKNRQGKKIILAIGADVEKTSNPDISIHNGFSHPEGGISDFDVAHATLVHFMSKITERKKWVKPIIIMHPTKKMGGAPSHSENKALIKLSYAVGARKAYLWFGRELKDAELMALRLPEPGDVLIVE